MTGNPPNVIKPWPSTHSDLGLTALPEPGAEPFLPCPGQGPLGPQPLQIIQQQRPSTPQILSERELLMGNGRKGQKEASSTWVR